MSSGWFGSLVSLFFLPLVMPLYHSIVVHTCNSFLNSLCCIYSSTCSFCFSLSACPVIHFLRVLGFVSVEMTAGGTENQSYHHAARCSAMVELSPVPHFFFCPLTTSLSYVFTDFSVCVHLEPSLVQAACWSDIL